MDTADTVAPWTRRLETPPLGPGLCRAETRHSASTTSQDTSILICHPAVSYKDNGEDSRVWDVLTRCPILCTDPGLELESGDTISGGSFCAGAGLVLLATCLSSDLGWVSCTVQHCTALYSTVHCTQLAAVSSPVSRLSRTITLSWTLATALLLHPAAILLVTTGDCQLQIVRTLHQARAQNMICCVWLVSV